MRVPRRLAHVIIRDKAEDPLLVTRCRLEDWARFHRDRTHLGLPKVSTYARDTFVRSPTFSADDEPIEILEVSVAVRRLAERPKRIIHAVYIWRRNMKRLAAEEGVSLGWAYKLRDAAVADVREKLEQNYIPA